MRRPSRTFPRYGAEKIARIEMGENKIRIIFLAPVLIFREAPSKSESFPALGRSSRPHGLAQSRPIEGHTDDRPLAWEAGSPNWELSPRGLRHPALPEISGVPQQRLSAIGYGEISSDASPTTPPRGAAPTAASRSTSSDARIDSRPAYMSESAWRRRGEAEDERSSTASRRWRPGVASQRRRSCAQGQPEVTQPRRGAAGLKREASHQRGSRTVIAELQAQEASQALKSAPSACRRAAAPPARCAGGGRGPRAGPWAHGPRAAGNISRTRQTP